MEWSGLLVPRSAMGGVISIGNFDGVHRGHQAMLAEVVAHAQRLSVPAVVVTFDPHPVSILRPDISVPRLTTVSTRRALLRQRGIDEMVVLPVDGHLLNMAPAQFYKEVIQGKLQAVGIVEGPDFRFGKDRSGDIDFLRERCLENGMHLSVFPAVLDQNQMISSTRIRTLLTEGEVGKAVELLGHFYTLSGTVCRGAGRGRTLGIPTANLSDVQELIPQNGVYAGQCSLNGKQYAVALSIGPNPTFLDNTQKVECHIIDFCGEIYGQDLQVQLTSRVRRLCKFTQTEDLIAQVQDDINHCKATFFGNRS